MVYELILASESPRRKELLEKYGFSFKILPSKISETPDENLNIDERILDISKRKSLAIRPLVQKMKTPGILLSADTEVVLENKTLGKPENPAHAIQMLQQLSGQTHQVKTGVVIWNSQTQEEIQHLETTHIKFKELTLAEITNYVHKCKPLDKAGSYGAQDEGKQFISEINGSFENVVGLPVHALIEIFKMNHWEFKMEKLL